MMRIGILVAALAVVTTVNSQLVLESPPNFTDFVSGWDLTDDGVVLGRASACNEVAGYRSILTSFLKTDLTAFPPQPTCVYKTHANLSSADGNISATFWLDQATVEETINTKRVSPSHDVHFLSQHTWKNISNVTSLAQFQVSNRDDQSLNFKFQAPNNEMTYLKLMVVLDEHVPKELLGSQDEPCEVSCTCSLRALEAMYTNSSSRRHFDDSDVYKAAEETFSDWAQCEATNCSKYYFALVNFDGNLDEDSAGDIQTVTEAIDAGVNWNGVDIFQNVTWFLFHTFFFPSHSGCVSVVETCIKNEWCHLLGLIVALVPNSTSLIELIEERAGADYNMSFSQAVDAFSCVTGTQQMVVELETIPCACNASERGTVSTFFDGKFGSVSGKFCHHTNTSVGTIVLGKVQAESLGKISTSPKEISPQELQELNDCAVYIEKLPSDSTNCTAVAKKILNEVIRTGPSLFDPAAKCSTIDERVECVRAELSIPLNEVISFANGKNTLPTAQIEAFSNHFAISQQVSNPAFLVLSVDTSDSRVVQSSRLKFGEDMYLWNATLVLASRPSLPANVTVENCHTGCHCADLYLAEIWEMRRTDSYLSVPLQEVPCACTPRSDRKSSRIIGEKKRSSDGLYSIVTSLELCVNGILRLEKNHAVAARNIKPKYNYLCDCESSLEDCIEMCKIIRSDWAWTCTKFPGGKEIQQNSSQHQEMKESSCNSAP